jgi:hypothetical protein
MKHIFFVYLLALTALIFTACSGGGGGGGGTVSAQAPLILTDLQNVNADYTLNALSPASLSVTADSTDGGTLSYQWFSNTSKSTEGGKIISGETSDTYVPSTGAVGTLYYYVVVTNEVSGKKTAARVSGTARITVIGTGASALPPAITSSPLNTSCIVDDAITLRVIAASPDGGNLSFQWFSNTVNSNIGGSAISGAASDMSGIELEYHPPTGTEGIYYYYAVVTNIGANGTASAASDPATVTVGGGGANTELPSITTHPSNSLYTQGDNMAAALTVAANVTGGELSYQWFSNTSYTTEGGTPINGATQPAYTPPIGTAGIRYYYAVVTNTMGGATAAKASGIAQITVNPVILMDALVPYITVHPVGDITYYIGETAEPLSVTAYPTDSGTLSYQWYKNGSDYNIGGTPVGTNSFSYTPPINVAGTIYYYVVVTNTNDGATGDQTAAKASGTAAVTVEYPSDTVTPVRTPQDLYNIRNNLSGHYKLMNNIHLSGFYSNWRPIGTLKDPFTGVLDGKGYKITGLSINLSGETVEAGLFGYLKGKVTNLGVEIAESGINVSSSYASYVGGIAGSVYDGTIENSYSAGNITVSSSSTYNASYAGGIAGWVSGETAIENSYFTGNITASSTQYSSDCTAGGIAGWLYDDSTIKNSYSAGTITASGYSSAYAGGIAGQSVGGTIENSYSAGYVTSTSSRSDSYAGGIAGSNTGTIKKSYSAGDITSYAYYYDCRAYAGGIAGIAGANYSNINTIERCAAINANINATAPYGSRYIRRVAGQLVSPYHIGDNFANSEMRLNNATVSDDNGNGIGRDLSTFQNRTTYESGLGWEFGNGGAPVWKMPQGGGNPILYWQND